MKIKLLKKGYKTNKNLEEDFFNGQIDFNGDYFSDEYIEIDKLMEFPIYMNIKNHDTKLEEYRKAIKVLYDNFISLERDIHFNERFWHSYLIYLNEYILEKYEDKIKIDEKGNFSFYKLAIIRNFNWENYIYKCIIVAEYIYDEISDYEKIDYYLNLFLDNLDVINYILKYRAFRNSKFFIKFLNVIDKYNLSKKLKKQLDTDEGKKNDLRVGRLVIEELNLSYPMLIPHTMITEDFEKIILKLTDKYYKTSIANKILDKVKTNIKTRI